MFFQSHICLHNSFNHINPLNPKIKIWILICCPIHFLQKKWGEVAKITSKLILCDHVRNSHDHAVLQSIDIIRTNLMLITLRAYRVNNNVFLTPAKLGIQNTKVPDNWGRSEESHSRGSPLKKKKRFGTSLRKSHFPFRLWCYKIFSLRSKRFQSSYSAPFPLPPHSFFFALVPTFSTNSRGNACYAGYKIFL